MMVEHRCKRVLRVGTYLTAPIQVQRCSLAATFRPQLQPESIGQPDQIDHRSGARFLSQTRTINLYSAMTYAELSANRLAG
jgi:hypothetical protein